MCVCRQKKKQLLRMEERGLSNSTPVVGCFLRPDRPIPLCVPANTLSRPIHDGVFMLSTPFKGFDVCMM